MKAIEWASDVLYREQHSPADGHSPGDGQSATNARSPVTGSRVGPDRIPEAMLPDRERRQQVAHRRADALAFIAERAMEWGVDAGRGEVGSSSHAERYQVVVHVGVGTLQGNVSVSANSPDPHRSEVEPGTRVSAETSRRLCCDAAVVRVAHALDGSVLDVGRRTRTIPPALRRALAARDRGCRFPGCESRYCEAHHIRHWAAGGETSLSNTLLLCRHHHRVLHEGRWVLAFDPVGRPVFRSPRGETLRDGRTAHVLGETLRDGRAAPV
jgi:hypothetical protein